MEPSILYTLAAELIRRHGGSLVDAGEALGQKLLDKGADAIAATAVGGLLGWLRARAGRDDQLDEATRGVIAAPDDDQQAISRLAAEIRAVVGPATAEFAALVHVAEHADAIVVTNIRFGAIKSAVYVETGGTAIIPHLDVEIS